MDFLPALTCTGVNHLGLREYYKIHSFQSVLNQLVMGTCLYLGAVILAVFIAAGAEPDIKVVCARDSVKVKWRVSSPFVPYAARLFLGSCMPSKWQLLPSGDGEAFFDYKFSECKFTKQIKGRNVVYRNELSFRPQAKGRPVVFKQPIECVYKRPEGWIPPFLNPGSGVSEGHSNLVFHMALLNEQLTGVAKTNVIPLGSFMPIWAAVEQKSHQPLLLLMDECVAATTPKLNPSSQVHQIVGNHGCLLESKRGSAVFLPRYHSSAIILYIQAFNFGLGDEVYIHCNLVVWDEGGLGQSRKACHVKDHGSWELLDDPSRSSVCSCCDSVCSSKAKRSVGESGTSGYNTVLGPLVIKDLSAASNATLVGSLPGGEYLNYQQLDL
uniref:Zona pellucida glycoprotein 3f, tandem duplicate 2 n=1 Tax=Oryzias sinensis TaxID=183150 RepID=A0A8C7YF16_9TELE